MPLAVHGHTRPSHRPKWPNVLRSCWLYAGQPTGLKPFHYNRLDRVALGSFLNGLACPVKFFQKYPRADIAGFALDMIKSAREAAGGHVTLKSIMETAAFHRTEDLEDAVLIALNGGVDCVKTSTGKHENGGATLEAAAVILDTIRRSKREVGIKISGGLRTAEQCAQYIALTQIFSGRNGARPQSFRFGGSSILSELISALPSRVSSGTKGNDIAPAY